jgi:hypothetical protein
MLREHTPEKLRLSRIRARPHRQHIPMTTGRRTDSGRGGNGGVGNVVMKASRSEAARAAVRADESNLPHARLQGQAPGGRRERSSCGEGDAAGATWRGRRRPPR